jgi:D-alanine-D-alanine ligase
MAMTEYATSALRVALLSGGDSAEREISLASGAQAAHALASIGHHVARFDPAQIALSDIDWRCHDVCFIALHGGAGEDGSVQRELERLGVRYTGSNPAPSQLAMSKSAAKRRFDECGVPTPPAITFSTTEFFDRVAARAAPLGYPLVVKPDGQGSSLGVGFAENNQELAARAIDASRYDSRLLIEPWIDGREFTVAVLGRQALPLLEIATPRGWFDYQAKYESDATEYRFETGLPRATVARLQSISVRAAAALETSGLVRVDLLLGRDGRPWVLELNTVPGLTSHSLAPKAAARAGLSFPALCDWMLRDALGEPRSTHRHSPETIS